MDKQKKETNKEIEDNAAAQKVLTDKIQKTEEEIEKRLERAYVCADELTQLIDITIGSSKQINVEARSTSENVQSQTNMTNNISESLGIVEKGVILFALFRILVGQG